MKKKAPANSYGIYVHGAGFTKTADEILRVLAAERSDPVIIAALGVLGMAYNQPINTTISHCTITQPHGN